MDYATFQVQMKLQIQAAEAEHLAFQKQNPSFWDCLRQLPVLPPFVPEVGKVYRDTFLGSDKESTVICLKNKNKEKPGSVGFLELRRGDLTGKKLEKKWFNSWEEYQDFLEEDEEEEDREFWRQRHAEEDEDYYANLDE